MGVLSKTIKSKKNEIKAKRTLGSVGDTIPISTGFAAFDYSLASRFTNAETNEEVVLGGFCMGKLVLAVGSSQSGKTTFLLQVANKMVEDLNGDVLVMDYERASNNVKARVMAICGITEEEFEERFTVLNSENMEIATLKEVIHEIVEAKKKLKEEDMVDWYDINMQPVKIYPPTVIVVDSIANMRGIDQIEDTNNMSAATIGRLNADVVNFFLNYGLQYNITLLCVNHIKKKIITNQYAKIDPVLPGLEKDENLPGGGVWAYNADYAIRFYSGGAQMKADKDYKVLGREVEARILKSRGSFNQQRIKLAMTSKVGFYAPLSNIMTLQDMCEKVNGTGTAGFYLDANPELKWKKSTLMNQYLEDDKFREQFDQAVEATFYQIALDNTDTSLKVEAPKRGRAKSVAETLFEEDDE